MNGYAPLIVALTGLVAALGAAAVAIITALRIPTQIQRVQGVMQEEHKALYTRFDALLGQSRGEPKEEGKVEAKQEAVGPPGDEHGHLPIV